MRRRKVYSGRDEECATNSSIHAVKRAPPMPFAWPLPLPLPHTDNKKTGARFRLLLLLVNVLQTDFSHNLLGRPQARGKDVSISGPWSQLINWFVRTLIYRKIVLGSASLSYTRIALVFCNFANWSQYFRSISDNSWTWVKWFANRTKNLEWHPGMGQCLHFSFFMLTGRMLDTNWVKLFATRNLLLIFKGRSGRKGRKGTFLALCFSPWARVEISRVSRARRVRKQATIKFNQWFIYKLWTNDIF